MFWIRCRKAVAPARCISVDARKDNPVSTPAVTMYSTQWCGFCHRLRSQLDREGIAYDVVDIERVPDAAFVVEQVNGGNQTVPTLVYADGTAQTNPSLAQVKQKLAAIA
jgi:mycoredoxin